MLFGDFENDPKNELFRFGFFTLLGVELDGDVGGDTDEGELGGGGWERVILSSLKEKDMEKDMLMSKIALQTNGKVCDWPKKWYL